MRNLLAVAFLVASATGTTLSTTKAAQKATPLSRLTQVKLNPQWTGSAVDSAAGGLIGASCGLMVSKVAAATICLTLWSSAKALPLTINLIFTTCAIAVLEKLDFVSVHWDELRAKWEATIARINSARERLVGELLSDSRTARLFGWLDGDIKDHVDANQHAAVGAAAGLAVGFLASAIGGTRRLPTPYVASPVMAAPRSKVDREPLPWARVTMGELLPKVGTFIGLVCAAAKRRLLDLRDRS